MKCIRIDGSEVEVASRPRARKSTRADHVTMRNRIIVTLYRQGWPQRDIWTGLGMSKAQVSRIIRQADDLVWRENQWLDRAG